MASKWYVTVLVLWTTILTQSITKGSDLESSIRKSVENSESEFSLSDHVRRIKIHNAHRIRREADSLMVKVKLNNGSYLYRKVTMAKEKRLPSDPVSRVPRGYSNKKKGKGYGGYEKPGYNYTKPTLAPGTETEVENDSDYVVPTEEAPRGQSPEKSAETTTTPAYDPWDIRDSVPGEPGKDYSVNGRIPVTNFTCEGRTPGFYADAETGCQVFHRCTDDPWYTGQVRVTMDSFLCPNGSLFNQQIFTCDWWGNVRCDLAKDFFQLNEQIGQLEETEAGTIQYVQFGGVRVPPPPGQKQRAPVIIPKSERKPLPDKYRSRHTGDHDHDRSQKSTSNGNNDVNGSGQRFLSDTDEDSLVKNFFEDDTRTFSEFSAKSSPNDEDEKDGSSQNIDEVSAKPPKAKKSSHKVGKKTKKSKTTTTTTPAPEEDDEDNDDESEEDDEDSEEETAATNDGSLTGLIVNRPPSKDQTDSKEIGRELKPPFDGPRVDEDKEQSENSDGDGTYIPPKSSTEGPTYIPPTKEPNNQGYQYPNPGNYLPPNKDGTYLPPKHDYLSGSSPPTATYLPPTSQPYTNAGGYSNAPDSYFRKPSSGYGSTGPPNNAYLPPQNQQNSNYLPPQQPNNVYLPPKSTPNNTYLPPNNQYPPQNQQTNAYLPPQQGYSTPVNNAYLPPQNQQNNAYLPPQNQQNNAYLPPQNQQNNAYLPPQNQQNNAYLPPQNQQNNAYLPSQNQQNNAYLPPQNQQNNAYLPPQNQQNNAYLPPQNQQNNAYLPPQNQQNNAYLPPQNQQNKAYLPPQNQQNNAYLPPQNKGYLPPNQGPSQQNNQYLPPQHSNQGYAQSFNTAYLPTPGYSPGPPPGYSSSSRPVTVEHWPAKYDYEAPTSLASSYTVVPTQSYVGPTPSYGAPVSSGYQQQKTQYQRAPTRDYLPVASPTTNSISYSTIPVQTPPSISNYGGQSRRPSINVELFRVPLLTSSHSHAPSFKR